MVNQKIYQVDAFTDRVFSGNPAAICPLETWPEDELMQKIAAENNLAETAFYVKKDDSYELRWFTPKVEVDLCGHATLATAYVLFHHEDFPGKTIRFFSPRSGELLVTKEGDFLAMNFPTDPVTPVELTKEMTECFNHTPSYAFKGKTDYMFVFDNESQIQDLQPVLYKIARLNARGVIATAKGDATDFVSRFFGPAVGIDEDPVTGSAHTTLIPYWAEQLNKTEMDAMQLSSRTGFIKCRMLGERVEISGQAKLYLEGRIVVR